jgi:hypothetical protein
MEICSLQNKGSQCFVGVTFKEENQYSVVKEQQYPISQNSEYPGLRLDLEWHSFLTTDKGAIELFFSDGGFRSRSIALFIRWPT